MGVHSFASRRSRRVAVAASLHGYRRLLRKRSNSEAANRLRSKLSFLSMARTKTPANIVGPQIRKRRSDLGLTQEELATRCQLQGFDISRGTLSQIEAQLRCVTDDELLALAQVLKVTTDSLFPPELRRQKKAR